MKKLVPALIAGLASFGASATPLTIDSFSTAQEKLTATLLGTEVASSVSGAGIIGTERDLAIEIFNIGVAADLDPQATVEVGTTLGDGKLFFSAETGVNAQITVQWDGVDGSPNLGFGLGESLADYAALELTTIFSDQGYLFSLGLYTSATEWSVITFPATGVGGTSPTPSPHISFIPLAGFQDCGFVGIVTVTCGVSPVDIANVNAIEGIVNILGGTEAVDLTLSAIRAVPEPGTLALVGLGMLGLALRRRIAVA